jgi:type II secretory ATPase GspE/PulE/Tfp pilus assembly ATPase PilB-like protein
VDPGGAIVPISTREEDAVIAQGTMPIDQAVVTERPGSRRTGPARPDGRSAAPTPDVSGSGESIIRVVDDIVRHALADGASDVHIEPRPDRVVVRTRLDGFLATVRELPRASHAAVVSRVKVMANLDIAERRVPQDGHIRLRAADVDAHLRVSTIPSRHGEKVVLRLFERERGLRPLGALGLADDQRATLEAMLAHPHGMLLVTGPTGCGKTTTLRACVEHLRADHLNIVSLEDPIEYEMSGVTQIQIHERVGLTFAETLRAVLRQDPDIIMVGEIRDPETADVAMRASLTGHLVLSTVHTNDAPGAVLRLQNLGVDPYLVATSMLGVVAQRLVRLVCRRCRVPDVTPREMLASFPRLAVPEARLASGRGCPACRQTGYHERTGIYEILPLDAELRALLGREAGRERFRDAIRAAGVPTLFDDGLRKVAAGLTTLAELLRVAPPPGRPGRGALGLD